jgi:hypothetical protein
LCNYIEIYSDDIVLCANPLVKHKWCCSEKFISNNHDSGRSDVGLYIQWKEEERERDSGETERERVCVRGRALR